MADPTPRRLLLETVRDVLAQITTANGYRTDAGLAVTLEPGQVDATETAVLAPVIGKQARPTDPAMRNSGRLTTLVIIAKVPARLDEAQARLDDLIADIEQAMDRPSIPSYPPGIQWPRYEAMEPVKPEPGMGWTGALLTYQTHLPIR